MEPLDKRDHPCPEAVTGLCRYRYNTSPPVSWWIGERTKKLLCLFINVGVTVSLDTAVSSWPIAFESGEKASQTDGIVGDVYCPDTVTSNYVQFWFLRFRSDMPVIENVDKTNKWSKLTVMLVVIALPRS
ncbi:hypothetical protein TNCV_2109411 [Trichonephila clavipes]|nr:hypothetical protein TNCV_2109411 [Trichonephila clavipes]